MKSLISTIKVALFSTIFVFVGGCATVPKEVVELSYITGRDLQSIQISYDLLIHQFYENLRSQRSEYLDNVWYPRFLKNWKESGELIAIATGEKIWSTTENSLIPTPTGTDPAENLATLNDWLTYALYAYEVKEEDLFKSLNEEESKLRSNVKQSFDQLIMANATITAHLNSLRKVQEIQDDALKALNVGDLREEINKGLKNASAKAENALKQIKDIDSKVDDLASTVE